METSGMPYPSDLEDEVEFLSETYFGKELILVDDDEEESSLGKTDKAVFIPEGHFRLMDLPAELRVYIYSFLLPHNLVISHSRSSRRNDGQPSWIIEASTKDGAFVPLAIGRQSRRLVYPSRSKYGRGGSTNVVVEQSDQYSVETQLFMVNKFISNEAKAVLYGSNIYKFIVNGSAHFPLSLRSPQIFGPFGEDDHLPMLRNLRSIHIDVLLDSSSHWAVKRQRARLEYFVEVLKAYSDDEDRKSLLQELNVEVRTAIPPKHPRNGVGYPLPPKDSEKFMFGLESLATLRGIKDVKVTGVSDWYAQCLQLCIQGKGGEVQETDWPLMEVRRSKGGLTKRSKKVWISTRNWYQPVLNWKEFAERNSIPIPADIDKFWMVVS